MENTIDLQFVEYIVKSLVGNPDAVSINRTIDEKGVLLELTVDPEDLGRVIGKRGATAQSLRTLLRALGTKNEARYNLKIIDNGEPRPEREDREQRQDDRPRQGQEGRYEQRSERRDDNASVPASDDSTSPATDDSSAKTPVVDEEAAVTTSSPALEDAWGSPSTSVAAPSTSDDDAHADAISKTRKDLADLDDLDI